MIKDFGSLHKTKLGLHILELQYYNSRQSILQSNPTDSLCPIGMSQNKGYNRGEATDISSGRNREA
jgi:hypothetical protein